MLWPILELVLHYSIYLIWMERVSNCRLTMNKLHNVQTQSQTARIDHAEVLNLELFTIIYTQQAMHHILWSVSPAWELLLLSIFHPERQSESQPAASSQRPGVRSVLCFSFSSGMWTLDTFIYLDTQYCSTLVPTIHPSAPFYNPPSACFRSLVITSATRSPKVGPIYVSITITICIYDYHYHIGI